MRLSRLLTAVVACATTGLLPGFLSGLFFPGLAHAHDFRRDPASPVEIYDRTDQRTLPLYRHDGALYVAGEPGHQYELRVTNRTARRLLAVTSVDGVNVISGKTADEAQTGYVLEPWADLSVEGWRKNMDEVATFYFTRLSQSYAARTGRPENVGVIGVALFREYLPCCRNRTDEGQEDLATTAPAAPRADADPGEYKSAPQRAAKERLGTGHGHREQSRAQYVDFQRAANTPEETIVIYYDSRKNLLAQGIIPRQRHSAAGGRPNPFPNGEFVPDP